MRSGCWTSSDHVRKARKNASRCTLSRTRQQRERGLTRTRFSALLRGDMAGDADGDGEVTRKEFHRAMPALGLEVPKEAIDDLVRDVPMSPSSSWTQGALCCHARLRRPHPPKLFTSSFAHARCAILWCVLRNSSRSGTRTAAAPSTSASCRRSYARRARPPRRPRRSRSGARPSWRRRALLVPAQPCQDAAGRRENRRAACRRRRHVHCRDTVAGRAICQR